MKVQLNTCSLELSSPAFNRAIGELVLSDMVRDFKYAEVDGRPAVDKHYPDAGWDRWMNSRQGESRQDFAYRVGELLTK